MSTKLTDKQIAALNVEYPALLEAARSQLFEHKLYMLNNIFAHSRETGMDEAIYQDLRTEIQDIRLDYVTSDPGLLEKGINGEALSTISMVWDYPDVLHAFLSSPQCPTDLAASLRGGVTLADNQVVT